MGFFNEFISELIMFVILIGTTVAGVFLGKTLSKNKNKAEKEEN